jgi:hypothetical protein
MRASLPTTAIAAVVLASSAASAVSADGMNPNVTLPLHAEASSFEPCDGYLPVNCNGIYPTVNIGPGPTSIFLLIWRYYSVAGVQTAFEVDPGWSFAFGLWDCQQGQLSAVTPSPPFGPTSGTITTAFNCITGPNLAPIGRMFFIAGSTGCLRQIQSSYPFGIHVLDCQLGADQITWGQDDRLGAICVGPGGITGCDPVVPAESATWGRVKAQYR